jgi:hypothetical protein
MDMVLELYKKGLPQFDQDIKEILNVIRQGENVCLCSAPKMGDNTLIDYLAYKLQKSDEFLLFYNSQNEINFEFIRNTLSKERVNKKVLLLIPWLHNPIPDFYKQFEELFLDSRENRLQSIIRLHFDFLIKPKKYFPRSIRPVSYVKIRKPLNFTNTKAVISQRRYLNGWKIPTKYEKIIFELSGGIPGLIKRLCSFINSNQNVNISDILEYPPMKMALNEFENLNNTFTESKLRKLGIIDTKGKVISPLIEVKINQKDSFRQLKLPPIQQEIFNYMYDKLNKIVSLDEISDINESKEFSLWKLYKQIARLKKQIAPYFRIQNVKGKGYILKHVNIDEPRTNVSKTRSENTPYVS